MSKKIEITNSDLVKIEPVTDNQKLVFESYKKGKNQFRPDGAPCLIH